MLVNTSNRRHNLNLNLDTDLNKWLKMGVQSFASFVKQDGASPTSQSLIQQSPMIEPYDEEGKIVPYPFNTVATNPFMQSDVNDKERHNYFFANVYAEVQLPIKGLTYRFNHGNK